MKDWVSTNTGSFKRSAYGLVDNSWNPGPYLAIVRNHLDPQYQGRIAVEFLYKTSVGNLPKNENGHIICTYLSPFYGTTPFEGTSDNDSHEFSQKSYGMWFVPPDVGTKVLVMVGEGDRCYWIGCVVDENVNFMLPGTDVATTYNNEDSSEKLPVGEYNQRQEFSGRDATKYTKPVNTDILNNLKRQGLDKDETRGPTTSSARREVPSSVFGISTPGPVDKRPTSPSAKYQSVNYYHNRLGGSSIVMDDGDSSFLRKSPAKDSAPEYANLNLESPESGGDPTIPHNEMLRLKTRTGHQILMHNSEDLIYIGNAQGSTWIELTANGKIDIYANDSVSVHTEADINCRAERDINFEAGRDINLKAGRNLQAQTGADLKITVGANSRLTTSQDLDINTGAATKITSNNDIDILSKQSNIIQQTPAQGTKIFYNSRDAKEAVSQEGLQTWNLPGPPDSLDITSILRRVPQHEPWLQHENLNPAFYTPTETDVKKIEGGAITANPPETASYSPIADTFRKGS